jgi:hypothetical protein
LPKNLTCSQDREKLLLTARIDANVDATFNDYKASSSRTSFGENDGVLLKIPALHKVQNLTDFMMSVICERGKLLNDPYFDRRRGCALPGRP